MANFDFSDITFSKAEGTKCLIVRGAVHNASGRDFGAVAIRVILFNRNIPLASFIVAVNGFTNGSTKSFEKEAKVLTMNRLRNTSPATKYSWKARIDFSRR